MEGTGPQLTISDTPMAETDAALGERADGSEARALLRPTVSSGFAELALFAAPSSLTTLTRCVSDKALHECSGGSSYNLLFRNNSS